MKEPNGAIFPAEALAATSPLEAMAPAADDNPLPPPADGVGLPLLKAQIAVLEQSRKNEQIKAEQAQIAIHKIDGALQVLRHLVSQAEAAAFQFAEEANRRAVAAAAQ